MQRASTVELEYRRNAVSCLQTKMRAAFRGGAARTVILDLQGLDVLGIADVRTLITLLRRSREVGGDIVLRIARGQFREPIAAMSLDKIFTIDTAA